MADLYRGLDAADVDGMARNAARIKAAGLSFVLTYTKWTKPAHIAALHNAGLAVGLIFEQGQLNALSGHGQGQDDSGKALAQTRALDVPASVPIFATVDVGVAVGAAAMDKVSEYFGAFGAIAGYACGDVLRTQGTRLRYPWLAGAMGWPGSRDYYVTGPWSICQGTPMRGGRQLGMDWPDLGFEYDPDVARNLDWAWKPPVATQTSNPSGQIASSAPDLKSDNTRPTDNTNIREAIKTLQALLASTNPPLYVGAIDGRVGPKTLAALAHFP